MLVRKYQEAANDNKLAIDVVRSAGTSGFSQSVLEFANSFVPVDTVIIRLANKDGMSVSLASATSLSNEKLGRVNPNYEAKFTSYDPNTHLMSPLDEADVFLSRCTEADIKDISFKRACWNQPGVIDRYSFLKGEGKEWVSMSLFREKASGYFSDRELTALDEMWQISSVAAEKHVAILSQHRPELFWVRIERKINECSELSLREREVCRQIVRGRSVEEIAKILTIGESSVITFRRRAYAKLNVGSRIELLLSFATATPVEQMM